MTSDKKLLEINALPILKIVSEARDILVRQIEHDHMRYRHLVESPIEEALAMALCVTFLHGASSWHGAWDFFEEGSPLRLIPQHKIGPYRVDFMLRLVAGEGERSLVIECDGHDFHERTKEQAAADRERDRWLQVQGFTVFRFTGSEIWNNPMRCAGDVEQWVQDAFISLAREEGQIA